MKKIGKILIMSFSVSTKINSAHILKVTLLEESLNAAFWKLIKTPAMNKFHIHGFQVVSPFKVCINLKSNIFITYLLQR